MFESASSWDGKHKTSPYHKNFKELSNYSTATSKFYNQKYALKKITIFLRKLLFFFINKFLM